MFVAKNGAFATKWGVLHYTIRDNGYVSVQTDQHGLVFHGETVDVALRIAKLTSLCHYLDMFFDCKWGVKAGPFIGVRDENGRHKPLQTNQQNELMRDITNAWYNFCEQAELHG